MSSKQFLKSIVPPLLWNLGSHLKRRVVRSTTLLEYAPKGWLTPLPTGTGGDEFWRNFLTVEQAYCEALIARIHAREPLLYPDSDENSKYAVFGYVLALASRAQQQITVLDYGGNVGDYYWLGRELVPGVTLDYHCKELPLVAEAGRQLSPNVTWHTDDDCFNRSFDLVMFSSSLQCLPNWQDILVLAGKSTFRYLLLSDIPTVRGVPSYVATHRSAGQTHLQMQLNRAELTAAVERAGLRLVREFAMGAHAPIVNAPEQPMCVGWLCERA
jgi:putative methyltransferase (TIGR04325 family)